jgi:limonene-1,2-epoxide hydrolase
MTRSRKLRFATLAAALALSTTTARAQEIPDDPCSAEGVVRNFAAAFSTLDAQAVASYLADDLVYTNTGMPTILGKPTAQAFMAQFLPLFSYASFEVLSLMSRGHEVLMRRVEHYTVSLQSPIGKVGASFDLPVMGRYVVRDCLIAEWGDYWDTSMFTRASGIPMPTGP